MVTSTMKSLPPSVAWMSGRLSESGSRFRGSTTADPPASRIQLASRCTTVSCRHAFAAAFFLQERKWYPSNRPSPQRQGATGSGGRSPSRMWAANLNALSSMKAFSPDTKEGQPTAPPCSNADRRRPACAQTHSVSAASAAPTRLFWSFFEPLPA